MINRLVRFSPSRYVVLVLLLALVFQPILVGDLFGYLVYGDWMIDHGRLTRVDAFSFTAAGNPWINHEWLFDLVVTSVHEALGWTGLMLVQLILVGSILLGVAGLVDRGNPRTGEWCVSLVVPVMALVPGLTLRPQLFTYLFLLIVMGLLLGRRSLHGSDFLVLPLLVALWSNLHGGVFVGLVFLGFLLVQLVVVEMEVRVALRAAALFFLCSLATLVNPYGIGLWRMILGHLGDPVTARFIQEWGPTWIYPYHMSLWCLLGLQWVIAFVRSRNGLNRSASLRVIGLIGVAVLALWPRRNLTYYGIAVAALSPPLRLHWFRSIKVPRMIRHGLLIGGFLGGMGLLGWTVASGFKMGEQRYPAKLLKRINPERSRNVLVHYPWAQWAFYRNRKLRVFLDGRWRTVFPDDLIRDYGKIILGDTDVMERYEIGWILLPGRFPVNRKLASREDWTLVDRTRNALLWRHQGGY